MPQRPPWQRIAFHLIGALLAFAFFMAGGTKLAGQEMHIENFIRWGYPLWFMTAVGLAEVIGAAFALLPRTRLFGAALITPIMLGALVTHIIHAEWAALPPVLILGSMAATLGYAYFPGELSAPVVPFREETAPVI